MGRVEGLGLGGPVFSGGSWADGGGGRTGGWWWELGGGRDLGVRGGLWRGGEVLVCLRSGERPWERAGMMDSE